MVTSTRDTSLKLAGLGAYFRPLDAERVGISSVALQRLVDRGVVVKAGHGVYRLAASEPSEFETIAMVCSRIPSAIVCLLSALRVHDLGTQNPHEVWLALDRKARKPRNLPAKVRFVRFSGAMLTYGVVKQQLLGVDVNVTSPARTVVDCFRYRNKLGLDVAIEALRDAVASRKATISEISRAAEVCRARTVMRPYLQSLAA